MGGMDADTIDAGTGGSVVLGDSGRAEFTEARVIVRVESIAPDQGGNDKIKVLDGNHVIMGGVGNDTIDAGNGSSVILGDNGEALYTLGLVATVRTTATQHGGKDKIKVLNGNHVIMGGSDNDSIEAGNDSSIILGDNGEATFSGSKIAKVTSIDIHRGGNDEITVKAGNHVLMGGSFNDVIKAGNGNHIILGDSGTAIYNANGEIDTVESRYGAKIIDTVEVVYDGSDTIDATDGRHVVFGGGAGDTIRIGSGESVVFGDSGFVDIDGTLPKTAYSTDTDRGGDDVITTGVGVTGNVGYDVIVVGGYGKDTITTTAGQDIIFGDSATLEFSIVTTGNDRTAVLQRGYTLAPTHGGDDTIDAGAGNDIVIGGTGRDTIRGGAGNDRILGDHGLYDVALPANQRIISIYAGENDGGAGDTIFGDDGDDIIVGQQGRDIIDGGAGDDDIIGGHNIVGGSDKNELVDGKWLGDLLIGGAGEDVVLGDNGLIARTEIGGTSWKDTIWLRNPVVAGVTSLRRDVVTFDHEDFIGGNDTIFGDTGNDRLYGQRGNDTINGGDGNDDIVGGLGSDILSGDAGKDIILGDEGQILRAFKADGSAVLDTDGAWHRDVVLEEVVRVVGLTSISSNKAGNPNLAADLLGADMLLLAGAVTDSGMRITAGSGAWDTKAIGVDLEPAFDDIINGGDGDDVLFGQRGNDTISGGAGADTIFGDRASNSAGFLTDLPAIINAFRIVKNDESQRLGIKLPVNGELVVPAVNLLPWEMTPYLPQLDVFLNAEGPLSGFVNKTTLNTGSDSNLKVFASLVADTTRAQDLTFGNDTIDGGEGNDTIFGDDGRIQAITETGLAVIDKEVAGLSVSMHNMLRDLSAMGFAINAVAGNANTTVGIGNDTIRGGGDNDTIFGDTGTIIVPSSQLAVVGTSPVAAAKLVHSWLMDLQTVVADMSYTARAGSETAIREFAQKHNLGGVTFKSGSALAGQPILRPATHTLLIGNDQIFGDGGNDMLIGDHGIIMIPMISASTAASLPKLSTVELKGINAALAAQDKDLTNALRAHIAAHHAVDTKLGNVGNWVFGGGLGYGLNVGNDQIDGGTENDVIVGDTAVIQQPNMLAVWTSTTSKSVADKLQAAMLKTVDRLYLGNLSNASARAEAWGVQSVVSDWSSTGSRSAWLLDAADKRHKAGIAPSYITLNSDMIYAGAGNDLVFGDFAAIIPIVGKTGSTGMITSTRVLPIGETSATQTANLRYVYNFGAQGPLHGAVTSDVNRRTPSISTET
ncbi:calcium-binding protein [Devosia aurantiaca]|uniref:Calcium-binding protein n=1 Tax=Devosia aurantiaca TaxID=2714858 RepID=A0A6M1STS6_9HYPH|nr:calcium-binding protein [Devosia aurantiaca]NGP18575.1 calcium-binding protein [Devosia aurantiaca]